MITSIGPVQHEGKSYDLLETNSENPSEYALWLRKETAKKEELARKYLETKDRSNQKYYNFTGILPESCERTFAFQLSDQNVARIKELVFEMCKDDYLDEDSDDDLTPDDVFTAVCEDDVLWELQGKNPELDDLIFNQYEGTWNPFEVHYVDLQHVYYRYDVTYLEYGNKPQKESVELTDEEYIYLLTQRLLSPHFNFNRLLLYRPELAQRLCVQLDGVNNEYLYESYSPFLIVFDEIDADAKAILNSK